TWQLLVTVELGAGMRVLQKAPTIMLALGFIMTMMATFYVRNHQQQSFRLARMNHALAQKNQELNNEIAERERLHVAVHQADREYRAIIDSVSDIIFETTTGGEIVFLNYTWKKVTGFDVEQALGRSIFDLLH